MTTISTEREVATGQPSVVNQSAVRLPFGLLGFEKFQEFVLLGRPEEAPFLWLQVKGDQKLAFLVVAPQAAAPYTPQEQVRPAYRL